MDFSQMRHLDLTGVFSREQLINDGLASVILIIVLLVLRFAALSALRSSAALPREIKRRWMLHVRNVLLLMFVIGLAVIWAKELQALAFSLVAVAVALVIAFKEFIMCFLGGIYKAYTRPFILGDIIDIHGHRGEVIDHDLISTTLIEYGPGAELHQYTGRIVKIPNSLMLTNAVVNETKQSRYVLHTIQFPFKRVDDWQRARALLLEVAHETVEPYFEEATRSFRQQSEREGFEMPQVKPVISLKMPLADEVHLYLRFPTPAHRRGYFEQRLCQAFAERFFGESPPPRA
jgi:small-conductance mechanosensitive channel